MFQRQLLTDFTALKSGCLRHWYVHPFMLFSVKTRFFFFFFFVFLPFSRATPAAYGGSQAKGLIGRSCSLRPTPEPQQLGIRAMSATYTTAHGNAGSLTTEQGQGSNLRPHSSYSDSLTTEPRRELLLRHFGVLSCSHFLKMPPSKWIKIILNVGE